MAFTNKNYKIKRKNEIKKKLHTNIMHTLVFMYSFTRSHKARSISKGKEGGGGSTEEEREREQEIYI